MSSARVGSAISAGGCCRADGGRRDARSRGPAAPGRRAARRATAGTRGGGRRHAGARRSTARTVVQRRRFECRCAPTVSGIRRRGEPKRVAGVVVGDLVVGDVDRRRDVGEHRPGQRVGQRRRGDAADLEPGRLVRQQFLFGGRPVGGDAEPSRPRRRPPVRSPAAGSASGAAGVPRWCPRAAATRRASRRAARASRASTSATGTSIPATVAATPTHRTVTFTAGE